jgi:hypothetical protein
MIWLRYALLVLIIPAYFVALSRNRWSTLPLWLVSTSVMLTQFALGAQQGGMPGGWPQVSALIYVGEMTKIMVIPIAVQLAIVLKSLQERIGDRANNRPGLLVPSLDASEL